MSAVALVSLSKRSSSPILLQTLLLSLWARFQKVSVNALNFERSVFIKSLERNTNLHVKECAQVLPPWTKSALLVSTEESLKRRDGRGEWRRTAAERAPTQRAASNSPCRLGECSRGEIPASFQCTTS